MTTDRPAKARWSKGRIKGMAWVAGAAAAIASAAVIAGDMPAPAVDRSRPSPRLLIERHVIKRVVIVDPPSAPAVAPVTVVQAAAPAAAPAPPVTTGGS